MEGLNAISHTTGLKTTEWDDSGYQPERMEEYIWRAMIR